MVELEHNNLQQSLLVNISIGTSTQIVWTEVHARNVNHILENNQPCKKIIISHANSHVGPTLPCLANSQVRPTSTSLANSQVGPTCVILAYSQVGSTFSNLANSQVGPTFASLANTPNWANSESIFMRSFFKANLLQKVRTAYFQGRPCKYWVFVTNAVPRVHLQAYLLENSLFGLVASVSPWKRPFFWSCKKIRFY